MTRTREEIDRRADRALAELRERHATGPPSRQLPAATRKRVSAGLVAHHARRTAADPNASPLERERYRRGWSLATTAAHAGLALNSVFNAEHYPEKATWRTRVSIARALGVPTATLFPDHASP